MVAKSPRYDSISFNSSSRVWPLRIAPGKTRFPAQQPGHGPFQSEENPTHTVPNALVVKIVGAASQCEFLAGDLLTHTTLAGSATRPLSHLGYSRERAKKNPVSKVGETLNRGKLLLLYHLGFNLRGRFYCEHLHYKSRQLEVG